MRHVTASKQDQRTVVELTQAPAAYAHLISKAISHNTLLAHSRTGCCKASTVRWAKQKMSSQHTMNQLNAKQERENSKWIWATVLCDFFFVRTCVREDEPTKSAHAGFELGTWKYLQKWSFFSIPPAWFRTSSATRMKKSERATAVFTGQKTKREVTRAVFEIATLRLWNECATR